MRSNVYRGIAILFLFSTSFAVTSNEQQIVSFKSAITINTDATMQVVETIQIHIPGYLMRRGLIRDFPTYYKDRWGNSYNVGFAIKSIKRDGKIELYHIKQAFNGVRIFIGDKDIILPGGIYTYEIVYETNRQLGFFEDHDELYWNVTGNGWPFAIEKATVDVFLPQPVPANSMTATAYTGSFGAKGQDFAISIPQAGRVHVETTRALSANQGLTIAIGWPKGIVAVPTLWDTLSYFIYDNLSLLWLLLGFCGVLAYCLIHYFKVQARNALHVAIPLFYPPKDLSPAQVRCFKIYGYDDQAFASELINMAVHGLITIKCKKNFLTYSYTIKKVTDSEAASTEAAHYEPLLKLLFAEGDSLVVSRENQSIILKAKEHVQAGVNQIKEHYLDGHTDIIVGAVIMAAFIILIGCALIPAQGMSDFFVPLAIGIIATIFLTYYGVRSYTQDGLVIKNEIDGFSLFLAATEIDRMEMIGTPPTRTPELYEKYLPYAVALGLEKQWSRQFAPIFAQMARQGHAYVPLWYHGGRQGDFASTSFVSDLSNSLHHVVSSSGSVPGSSSGSDGSGSSGGGGGGGGGGTW